jgi:hypothetical protein
MELDRRRRLGAWLVAHGKISEKRAARQVELMAEVVEFLVDALFYHVTNQGYPLAEKIEPIENSALQSPEDHA